MMKISQNKYSFAYIEPCSQFCEICGEKNETGILRCKDIYNNIYNIPLCRYCADKVIDILKKDEFSRGILEDCQKRMQKTHLNHEISITYGCEMSVKEAVRIVKENLLLQN